MAVGNKYDIPETFTRNERNRIMLRIKRMGVACYTDLPPELRDPKQKMCGRKRIEGGTTRQQYQRNFMRELRQTPLGQPKRWTEDFLTEPWHSRQARKKGGGD